MDVTRAAPLHVGRAQQWATRASFFIAGFAVAAWAPLVPYVRERLALDDRELGFLLLAIGVGSIIAMPLTALMIGRFGCRTVCTAAGLVIALALPFLSVLPGAMAMAAALAVFGFALGTLDVAMNVHAVGVERLSGRAMMSGFHALYSLGGMLGAAFMAALFWLGLPPFTATLVVSAITLVILSHPARHLLPERTEQGGPSFAIPRGIVLALGIGCLIVFMTEGAVLDWSAVYLTTMGGVALDQAGFAYAAFAVAMTLARLLGDRTVRALGPVRMLLLGGLGGAAGFLLVLTAPAWPLHLLGFVLVGLGCANLVPVLFTATGRQTVMPATLALAAVTTLGYVGVLAGPAAIGFIAHATSLSTAFVLLALLLVGIAACSSWLAVRPPARS